MCTKTLTVLFLLSCTQVFAVRPLTGTTAKSLLQDVSTVSVTASASSDTPGSVSTASGSATLAGPGSVVVDARAMDIDITAARDQFAMAVADAISTDVPQIDELDDIFAIVDAIVPPYAQGVADAFDAATSVQVTATGESASACAQATISPDAAARAAAQALVEVLTQASDRITFASVSDAVDAIVSVTVGSFQSAQIEFCANTPSPFSNIAAQIQTAYRDVTLLALAVSNPSTVDDPIVVTVADSGLSVLTINGEDFIAVLNPVIVVALPAIAFFDG